MCRTAASIRCSTSSRAAGKDGRYTYPDDDPNAVPEPAPPEETSGRWTRDGVLLVTRRGHLHPGGLNTDMLPAGALALPQPSGARQAGADPTPAHLFRSDAHYYEPAGWPSPGMSRMTATKPDWRVAVKGRRRVCRRPRRTTRSAPSWLRVDGDHGRLGWADGTDGLDPFKVAVDQARSN